MNNFLKVTVILASIAIGTISFSNNRNWIFANDVTFFNPDTFQGGFIPKEGFVPDEATAIKIAEAIWFPIYGDTINQKEPFKARLIKENIWLVEGTLKENMLGGVPYAYIQKSDGKILQVIHTK